MKTVNNNARISDKSMTRKVINGTGWSYLERFSVRIVALAVTIVLSRMLLPEHYGTMAVVTILIMIFDTLVEGGFGNALVQKKDSDDLDFNSICWLSIGLSILLYGLLYFAAPVISLFYKAEILTLMIRIMGVKLIFSAYNGVQLAYVQKQMIFHKSFFATLGSKVFAGALGVFLALNSYGVWALVVQYLINTVIDTIIFTFLLPWKPQFTVSFKRIRSLWRYGGKLLVSSLISTTKENVVILLIGKQFSSNALAYYNQGQNYPIMVVSDIMESFAKVIFPVFSQKPEQIKRMMKKALSISSYFMMPMIIGLFAVAENFVEVLLTEKWLPCVPYLRIFCLVCIGRTISNIFQKALLALGKSNIILYHGIITAAINIFMVLMAIFYFQDVILLAWSYAMVSIVGTGYYIIVAKRYCKYTVKDFCGDYLVSFGLSVIMGVIVFSVNLFDFSSYLKLLIQVLAGGLFYLGISFLTHNKNLCYILALLKSFKQNKVDQQ